MSNTQDALVAITYVPFQAPMGSTVDHITVSAVASNTANNPPSQDVVPGTPTVTFSNLAPDTYTFSAQAMAADGTGFSVPVTVTLTITSSSVTLQVPGTITATQP